MPPTSAPQGSRPPSERRAHPRAKAEFPITIGAADRRVAARVRDLSRSGVAFSSPVAIAEMTKVACDLDLPAPVKRTVKVEGAVVRCAKAAAGFEVAVFFTTIADADRAAIGALVEAKLATV
ncbi:MAG TPA: PilZ domain-containing protein [Planctomycetota bacterium]|nr:PilZ domain-containing protein [Planctomycetota bacterium]